MRKAFTTIELIVAVSLLAVVMVISGMVFKVAINAQRQAGAIAEITRNFRSITDQINRDFQGLVKEAPVAVVFNPTTYNAANPSRLDSITFFATGDFQSSRQYGNAGNEKTIKGNVARIHYGLASGNILSRKVKILILNRPAGASQSYPDDANEFEETSLSNWQAKITADINDWVGTNSVDANVADDIPLYFAGNVMSFSVQGYDGFVTSASGGEVIRWFPSEDTTVSPTINDFPLTNDKLLFNSGSFGSWTNHPTYGDSSLPKAVKFTMTLYDSRGVIKEGKTFTYIVYIGE